MQFIKKQIKIIELNLKKYSLDPKKYLKIIFKELAEGIVILISYIWIVFLMIFLYVYLYAVDTYDYTRDQFFMELRKCIEHVIKEITEWYKRK